MVNKKLLKSKISEYNLSGKVINLYSSYKSFGGVEGGPISIIDAFLESGCTLVVPTFSYSYAAYPPLNGLKYRNNGIVIEEYSNESKRFIKGFSKLNNDIHESMGVIPKLILERSERYRGDHPLNSFTAIGPKAKEIIEDQSYLDVYSPFKKMLNIEDSILLLIGVDFSSTTAIHFSEEISGRNLFRSWAYLDSGSTVEVAIGSCSNGFNNLDSYTKSLRQMITVGESSWGIYNFKSFISLTSSIIKLNSQVTHCNDNHCIRCRDSILGGPVLNSLNRQ